VPSEASSLARLITNPTGFSAHKKIGIRAEIS
jgi:hypothetical protein